MSKKMSLYISIGISAVAIFLILASLSFENNDSESHTKASSEDQTLSVESQSEASFDFPVNHRNPASSPESRTRTSVPGTVDEWLKEWGASTEFKFLMARDGRTILSIMGGNFRDVGHSDETAFDFLSRLAKELGVDPSQLDRESLFTSQTIRSQVYGYEQVFKGYPVFNSSIKVKTKRDDHAAVMIHNSLKTIPQSTPLPEVVVSLDEAKRNALDILKKDYTSATEAEDGLVVWADENSGIDLAWSLILQGDHISEYVLVSATTGEILANFSAQSH